MNPNRASGTSLGLFTFFLLLFLATPAMALGGDVLKVPSDYGTIQEAINAAQNGDTVLVAMGVYTGPGNRDLDLAGKAITVRSTKGPKYCVINCEASFLEPHRGFLFQSGEGRDSVVRGFTIMQASTEPGAIADQFNGGAILITNSSPTIQKCIFKDNVSGCWGGAVYSGHGGSPLIEDCAFVDNYSGDDGGGFFSWNGSNPVIRNSLFLRNEAVVTGGAISVFGNNGGLTLENVTVVENIAPHGGGILTMVPITIRSSVIWNNQGNEQLWDFNATSSVTFTNIEGGFTGTGNLDKVPLFRNDGWHLRRNSPCIDAGDPAMTTAPAETDLDGQPRRMGPRMDMGADEFPNTARFALRPGQRHGGGLPPTSQTPDNSGTPVHN